jgi:hypothetical protein
VPLRIYLDACCLNRLTDHPRQPRFPADGRSRRGCPSSGSRRRGILGAVAPPFRSNSAAIRTKTGAALAQLGFGAFDALHLGFDDRLLNRLRSLETPACPPAPIAYPPPPLSGPMPGPAPETLLPGIPARHALVSTRESAWCWSTRSNRSSLGMATTPRRPLCRGNCYSVFQTLSAH